MKLLPVKSTSYVGKICAGNFWFKINIKVPGKGKGDLICSDFRLFATSDRYILFGSVGDPNPNPNPNPKGSERFEGSESDQTVRIRIRIRKDPNANFIEQNMCKKVKFICESMNTYQKNS